MFDNTNEGHLDIPINIQSENLSDDITPTTDTKTINPNQESENMEVHKHPHHVSHKKKWGEYLLEFLMIFLAVFLGFLAEYQLEHVIEKQRANDFALSLQRDLVTDTAVFNMNIERLIISKKKIDTLVGILSNTKEAQKKVSFIYNLSAYAFILPISTPTESTLQQLLNSGSLRYLKDNLLVDSIKIYNNSIQLFKNFAATSSSFNNEFRKSQLQVIEINPVIQFLEEDGLLSNSTARNISDSTFFSNRQLLTIEPLRLKEYANWCALKNFYLTNTIIFYKKLNQQATDVLRLLNKQYIVE
jgi:hypothetical protein